MSHFAAVGFEAEVFYGVSSKDSGLVTTHLYEVDAPGSGYKIGKKEVACFVSFYMAWSAMIYMPQKHFWTVEFDCKYPPDWRAQVEQALKDVPPDFDLLYVGSCCCKGKPMKHIKGNVYEMNQMQCGHSTIIAKKALPVMLATQRKVWAPLDISLAFLTLPKLKCYAILPRVADQFDTFIAA